ncbi:hypothetical protein EV182_002478 [Spiromyces aspiralis]|uniref:Uncharacterized protein n=1 Tax=Spiromyces aspiralis TaxID=68401 RepID=A0ACC1HHY9_9FUNG|nr:hypothetical protein EV182_002478 [Spiromyces aspiralis]
MPAKRKSSSTNSEGDRAGSERQRAVKVTRELGSADETAARGEKEQPPAGGQNGGSSARAHCQQGQGGAPGRLDAIVTPPSGGNSASVKCIVGLRCEFPPNSSPCSATSSAPHPIVSPASATATRLVPASPLSNTHGFPLNFALASPLPTPSTVAALQHAPDAKQRQISTSLTIRSILHHQQKLSSPQTAASLMETTFASPRSAGASDRQVLSACPQPEHAGTLAAAAGTNSSSVSGSGSNNNACCPDGLKLLVQSNSSSGVAAAASKGATLPPITPPPGYALPPSPPNTQPVMPSPLLSYGERSGLAPGVGSVMAGTMYTRSLEDYTLLNTLGTGTFGRVYLCHYTKDKNYYAMKILRKSQVVKLKQVEHINNEKTILEEIKFPFIVNL